MQLFSASGASTVLREGRLPSIHPKTGSEQDTSSCGISPDSSTLSICATANGAAASRPAVTRVRASRSVEVRAVQNPLSPRRAPRYTKTSQSIQPSTTTAASGIGQARRGRIHGPMTSATGPEIGGTKHKRGKQERPEQELGCRAPPRPQEQERRTEHVGGQDRRVQEEGRIHNVAVAYLLDLVIVVKPAHKGRGHRGGHGLEAPDELMVHGYEVRRRRPPNGEQGEPQGTDVQPGPSVAQVEQEVEQAESGHRKADKDQSQGMHSRGRWADEGEEQEVTYPALF